MAEGVMEDDGPKGKDTVEPASISFSIHSFDSSCLTAFRDNKLCCPECCEAANNKSEPKKFDFYVFLMTFTNTLEYNTRICKSLKTI